MSRPKYRPVLTHSQIIHLISLCKSDMSLESRKCISVLSPYEHKIQSESVSPAHISTRQTLSESMGLSPATAYDISESPEGLYNAWKVNPSDLTLKQLDTVAEYRYTNDMMSPQDETIYENSLIQSPKGA